MAAAGSVGPLPQRGREGGARLGRGLRHPPASPADSGRRVHRAGPTPYDRPDPREFTTGSPERQRRDPPAGTTHLRRRLPARARLCPPQTPAGASPAASDGGRGRRPRPTNQEWPPGALGQSTPRFDESGGAERNIPEGSRLVRLFPTPLPRGAVDLPAPPKPRRAVPPQGGGGGSRGWAPANRGEGRRRVTNGKRGPWATCCGLSVSGCH